MKPQALHAVLGLLCVAACASGAPADLPADAGPTDLAAPDTQPATDAAVNAPVDTAAAPRTRYPGGTLITDRALDFAFVVPPALKMLAPAGAEIIYDAFDAQDDKTGYVFLSRGKPSGVGGGAPQVNPLGVAYFARQADRLSGLNYEVFFLASGDRVAYAVFAQEAWRDQFVALARWLH